MHDNLQMQPSNNHHPRTPVSPQTRPLSRNPKECLGPQPLGAPTEPVPSLPHHSCSNHALPPTALRALKQPRCASSQHTNPATATADCTAGDIFPAVCTKAVPVDGRDVGSKGPPLPHPPPATKYSLTSMAIEATGQACPIPAKGGACPRRRCGHCLCCGAQQ